MDALITIGGLLVGPVVGFALKTQILHSIFRSVASLATEEPNVGEMEERERLVRHLKWDCAMPRIIPTRNFCSVYANAALYCRRTKYQRMQGKAEISLSKELDLVKFIKRQRFA